MTAKAETIPLPCGFHYGNRWSMETVTSHPLKAYRERQVPPLSQGDLARRLGLPEGTLSRYETGKRLPDVSKLPKIVKETGIPARELRPDLAKLFAEPARSNVRARRKARPRKRAA